MAKVNITVDTETNLFDVSVNGKNLNDLQYVSISKFMDYSDWQNPKPKISFTAQQVTKEEDGLTTYTNTCASEEKFEDLSIVKKDAVKNISNSFASLMIKKGE